MVRAFLAGMVAAFLLLACAGATFPYQYYGVDVHGGKLLGPTPQDDLELTVCDSTQTDKAPCTAMLSEAFFKMKKDYLDTKLKLIECQQAKP